MTKTWQPTATSVLMMLKTIREKVSMPPSLQKFRRSAGLMKGGRLWAGTLILERNLQISRSKKILKTSNYSVLSNSVQRIAGSQTGLLKQRQSSTKNELQYYFSSVKIYSLWESLSHTYDLPPSSLHFKQQNSLSLLRSCIFPITSLIACIILGNFWPS